MEERRFKRRTGQNGKPGFLLARHHRRGANSETREPEEGGEINRWRMRGDRRNTDGRRRGRGGSGGEERRFTFTFFLFRSDAAKKKLPPLLCNPYMRLRRSPPPTPVFRTVCSSLTPLLPPRHIKEILTPGLKLHKRAVKRRRGSNWPNCSDVAAGIIYGGAELSRCPRRVITSAASKILISAELMLCLVAQTAAAAAADVVFRVSADRPS